MGQDKIVSNTYSSFDNDSQMVIREYVGYEKKIVFNGNGELDNSLNITPLIGRRLYFQSELESKFTDYNIKSDYKYGRMNVGGSLSLLYSNNWSPILFDGFVRYNNDVYSIELFCERDFIGSVRTNEMKYLYTSLGISLDYRLIKNLTIVNSLSRNKMSDGNIRWNISSKAIYSLDDDSYFDLRVRRVDGRWSQYYFSKNRIEQYNIGYGLNHSFVNGLIVKIYFSSGFQKVDNNIVSMLNTDLRLKKNFVNKLNIELILGSIKFDSYLYNTCNIKIAYRIVN